MKLMVSLQVVKCDGITCTEMKEERPWREHIDYHGLAAISYCLLFQTYMETVKVSPDCDRRTILIFVRRSITGGR